MGGRGGNSHFEAVSRIFQSARSFLTQAYGALHARAVLSILSKAPAYIQAMWQAYAEDFRAIAVAAFSDDAYYSPGDDSVHLNIARVARGDRISTPYSTLFHEYGHMTDYLIARQYGLGRYSAYSQYYQGLDSDGEPIFGYAGGGLLGRTAKDEVSKHISRMMQKYPGITKQQAATALANEIKQKYSELDRSDVSDMLEGGGLGIAYPLGAGHGLGYWHSRDSSLEIFAEMTSAEASHPGSLKAIKEYFPDTYKVYRDMTKGLKKKK